MSYKSSPNLPTTRQSPDQHPSMTVEDFKQQLTIDPTMERRRGRRSSCAVFEPDLDDVVVEEESAMPTPTPFQLASVEPQDLAMLRAMRSAGIAISRSRQRTLSDTSKDGDRILQSMDPDGQRNPDNTGVTFRSLPVSFFNQIDGGMAILCFIVF